MLISSEAGAGQIVSPMEETRFYDDLGCLAADWPSHSAAGTAFVAVGNGAWKDARDVFYARPGAARTAMASGVLADLTAAEAQAADRDKHAFTWDELVHESGDAP